MPPGDCFKVVHDLLIPPGRAEQMLTFLGLAPLTGALSPLRGCHGLPIARVGPLKGQRHWHAWVELRQPSGVIVLDLSNDRQLKVSRDVYYELGSLGDADVWRFTPVEARQKAAELGTAGPWVEDWRELSPT